MLSSLSLLDVITGTGNTSRPSLTGLGGLLGDLVVPELAVVALEDIFGKGVCRHCRCACDNDCWVGVSSACSGS